MLDREYPFPLLLPSLVRQGHYQYPETDVYPSLLCSFPPFYYINAHLNKIAFKHYTNGIMYYLFNWSYLRGLYNHSDR